MKNTDMNQEYKTDRKNQQKAMMTRMAAYQKRYNLLVEKRRTMVRTARKG